MQKEVLRIDHRSIQRPILFFVKLIWEILNKMSANKYWSKIGEIFSELKNPSLIFKKIKRFLIFSIKKIGGYNLSKIIWNHEYLKGSWDYLDEPISASFKDFLKCLTKYLNGGDLLDVGCGTGNVCLGLNKYNSYLGIDVSKIAIEKAKRKCFRKRNVNFIESDFWKIKLNKKFDIILFCESLYYVSNINEIKLLKKYCNYLKSNGFFIVHLYDQSNFLNLIEKIKNNFHIEEEILSCIDNAITLIFNCL